MIKLSVQFPFAKRSTRFYRWMGYAIVFFAVCGSIVFIQSRASLQFLHLPVRVIRIGDTRFAVEVAQTPAERARGLMDRHDLCDRCGMLFLFDRVGRYPFWMHRTPQSLDILWIYEGHVVALVEHAKPTSDDILMPDADADHVVEIPAGSAAKYNIVRGTSVSLQ